MPTQPRRVTPSDTGASRLPEYARDVLDAVHQGIMSREEARRYLGLAPPPFPLSTVQRPVAQAFPQLADRSRDVRDHHPLLWYLARVGLGICWRTCFIGAAILIAQSGYAPPLAALGVLILLGSVAGLWRRPGGLGQVWRWAALSMGVAWLGPVWASQYGHIVGIALILAVMSPWLTTRRPG